MYRYISGNPYACAADCYDDTRYDPEFFIFVKRHFLPLFRSEAQKIEHLNCLNHNTLYQIPGVYKTPKIQAVGM